MRRALLGLLLAFVGCSAGTRPEEDGLPEDATCPRTDARSLRWSTPEPIDDEDTVATYADIGLRVVSDGVGGFVVAWRYQREVWVNRYDVRSGWEGAARLSRVAREGPQIASGGPGRWVVVWTAFDGEHFRIHASRTEPRTSWLAPEIVHAGPADAASPKVAMDATGAAVVVWRQRGTAVEQVWASRFEPTRGWEEAFLIQADDGPGNDVDVGMDASGRTLVVWRESPADHWSGRDIWARWYDPHTDAGWGAPSRLDEVWNALEPPSVAIDRRGNAFVFWWGAREDERRDRLVARRHTELDGWGPVAEVARDLGYRGTWPAVAASGARALAFWVQREEAEAYVARAGTYEPREGWTNAAIVTNRYEYVWSVAAAVACDGAATAVWTQPSRDESLPPGTHVFASRRAPGDGWSAPTLIDDADAEFFDVRGPAAVAMSDDGTTVVAWPQNEPYRTRVVASVLALPY